MENQFDSTNSFKPQENSKSTLILILGILSFPLGFLCGIPAWIIGASERRKIKMGVVSAREKGTATIGMVMGILGTLISISVLIYSVSVGLNIYKSSSMRANRDALISNATAVISLAQQYYHNPKAINGGDGSFEGFILPDIYKNSENGKIEIKIIGKDNMLLTGVGKEIGKDGINKVKIIMNIAPERISKTNIIN